jgi:hypothetical protein
MIIFFLYVFLLMDQVSTIIHCILVNEDHHYYPFIFYLLLFNLWILGNHILCCQWMWSLVFVYINGISGNYHNINKNSSFVVGYQSKANDKGIKQHIVELAKVYGWSVNLQQYHEIALINSNSNWVICGTCFT